MSTAAWWTDADGAELDVLILELVNGYFRHREVCKTCRQQGPWCQPLRDALDAILEWRTARELKSLAAYLRAERHALEQERAA